MKKLIAGTFVVMAIAAVVLYFQYAWKPDHDGQEAKQLNKLIYKKNPFPKERVFFSIFVPQNSTTLEKEIN